MFITSGMDKCSWKQENSQRGNMTYRGRKIVNKGKKMADREEGAAAPNQRQGQNQQQNQEAAGQQHLHINWSNFKPEFLGKPEEDAEAYLLCPNDWMNTHCCNEDVMVQRFCLTLLGEARLWFHSLEPLKGTTWPQLQNLFRQRNSKLGNTCEQLFHAWGSFTFDENTETIDSCVMDKTSSNTFRLWRATNIRSI